MKKISRREFLSGSAAGIVAAALSVSFGEIAAEAAELNINTVESGESGAVSSLELTDEEKEALIASHTDDDGRTHVSVSVEADIGTMTPYGSGTGKVQHVIRNALFETAFCVLTDGSLGPVLATDYEQIDDVTYEIHFKDYIYDTEGNHLTAEDVVFSWLCGRDDWNSGNMSYIAEATATDDYTVQLVMTDAQVGTFEKIMYEGWIFTQAAYEASSDQFITTPVGTSPYRLVSWETGSEVIIEKTDNYWETDEDNKQLIQVANVDVITYKVISEASQMILSLQTDEVDMIHKVDYDNLELLADDYQIFGTLNNQVMTMMFNCSENSVCGDVNVRQAICYAIDTSGVLTAVCSGQGITSYCFGTDECNDVYDSWDDGEYYNYDLDKATELLAEAGYDSGNPLTITIMYETTDKNAPTAEIIQAYLMAVGINATLMPLEGATYTSYKIDSTTGWDLHLGSVGGFGPYCIGSWFGALDASNNVGNTNNVVGLLDAEFSELLNTCYTTSGHTEEKMTAANEYIEENAFVYALYQYNLYTVTCNIFSVMNLRCGGREIAPQYCTYIWNE